MNSIEVKIRFTGNANEMGTCVGVGVVRSLHPNIREWPLNYTILANSSLCLNIEYKHEKFCPVMELVQTIHANKQDF